MFWITFAQNLRSVNVEEERCQAKFEEVSILRKSIWWMLQCGAWKARIYTFDQQNVTFYIEFLLGI